MRERKRRHDDLHRPMTGKGRRAFPASTTGNGARLVIPEIPDNCDRCGMAIDSNWHKYRCGHG